MKNPIMLAGFILTLFFCQCIYGQDISRYKIQALINLQAIPFDLNEVRLLPGSPFKKAMDINAAYLLQLEPDRFLSRWRSNAGLLPKAPIYGGWETTSSHMLGHYLSALVLQYAASGDTAFLNRANYVVDELDACQQARHTGYIGGIPGEDSIWKNVTSGNIRTGGFDLNGGWVPWYMLHKVWAGLIDAYLYTGNEKAKDVVVRLSDWAYQNFINLPEEKFQQMMECEFGGMNESIADVYAITGDKKYLDLSYKFYHKKVMDPLAMQQDQLGGLHANTQIPKVIGSARQYELTGNQREHTIADFFFQAVTRDHSYANGGNSNYEYFSQKGKLATQLGNNTSETCNSYNMLKLDRHLFGWDPSVKIADYYERTLYNHILASQQHETGMMCYYVALQSGKEKVFSTPFDAFWCCVGTGIENHAKYGEAIYFKGADGSLFVNLFIASSLNWKEKNIQVYQETNYPAENFTTLRIDPLNPVQLKVRLRYPGWARNGAVVKINGTAMKIKTGPGNYIIIDRIWKKGDVITAKFPMELYPEAIAGDSSKKAFFYGPVLLAGCLGKEKVKGMDIPVLITGNKPISNWLQPVKDQPLVFHTTGVARPKDIELIPFYEMEGQKHIVYWDISTEEKWEQKKFAYKTEQARLEELETRTVDLIRMGEQQPELDHHVTGENTGVGEYDGDKFRDAPAGGWFSFELKCDPDKPVEIYCTYNGSDGGNRAFDILVDDVKIKSEKLVSEKPRQLVEHIYPLPADLTKDKTKITIKFQAQPGNIAGALFACRLVTQIKK